MKKPVKLGNTFCFLLKKIEKELCATFFAVNISQESLQESHESEKTKENFLKFKLTYLTNQIANNYSIALKVARVGPTGYEALIVNETAKALRCSNTITITEPATLTTCVFPGFYLNFLPISCFFNAQAKNCH